MKQVLSDLMNSVFPDTKHFPEFEYIKYKTGNHRIVLSAPHGGNIKPWNIPRRKSGSLVRDTFTKEIVKKLAYRITPHPYIIYSELHRSRIDLNRDKEEATEGNPKMEQMWESWNTTTQNLINDSVSRFGRTLYIDFHSHNNSDEFHLGYGITKEEYIDIRDGRIIDAITTLRYLYRPERDMLFGYGSIKDGLERYGYSVHTPRESEQYFNGGRNSRVFYGKNVGTIQLEIPVSMARQNMNRLVLALEFSIMNFVSTFVESRKVPRDGNYNETGGQ